MAIIAKDIAIVSLGLSCQTAAQLQDHADLFTKHLTDASEKATPLDWLFVRQDAIAELIRRRRFFPDTNAELSLSENRLYFYWPSPRVIYTHQGMREADEIGDHDAFDRVANNSRSKFSHTTTTLVSVADRHRKVFIISNSQNNLPTFDDILGERWWFLSDGHIEELRRELEAWFGSVEIYVATYRDRHSVGKSANRVFELMTDQSRWRGDSQQWQKIFKNILDPGR